MESDPVPFVKPNNSLLVNVKRDKVVNILISKLSLIANAQQLKDDLEFLKYACLIVENLIYNKPYRDKLDVALIIIIAFEKIFTHLNKDLLRTQIQFLYDNKQVKAHSILNKVYAIAKHIAIKKKKSLLS